MGQKKASVDYAGRLYLDNVVCGEITDLRLAQLTRRRAAPLLDPQVAQFKQVQQELGDEREWSFVQLLDARATLPSHPYSLPYIRNRFRLSHTCSMVQPPST